MPSEHAQLVEPEMTPAEIVARRKSLIRSEDGKQFSQADFAALVGVHPVTVANWETGEHQPEPPTRKLIRMVTPNYVPPERK
jgi:DNA-binding transcriptional regulator YiaG